MFWVLSRCKRFVGMSERWNEVTWGESKGFGIFTLASIEVNYSLDDEG